MKYYPINLNLKNRPCLVVGGGSIATRKINTLIKSNAKVTVISPEINSFILKMYKQNLIFLKKEKYKNSDINGFFLVIGATNDKKVNIEISNDATKNMILCNIVDKPELCNFILPSILTRGDFILTISTSGKSPAFAKKIRKDLESKFGPEYKKILELMGAIRIKLQKKNNHFNSNKFIYEKILNGDLISLIRKKQIKKINNFLYEILGKDFKYEKLIK